MWKFLFSKGYENRIDTPLKEKEYIHEVEHISSWCGCREEHEEEGDDKHRILVDGDCANQREYTNGSLNYEGVPIDGCSQLYAGDIEIRFENVVANQIYHCSI